MKVKFKIGERVVYAYPWRNEINPEVPLGEAGYVEEEDDCPFILFDDYGRRCFIQDELEYENIYNSPLIKALK
jgi:hypothetical protein